LKKKLYRPIQNWRSSGGSFQTRRKYKEEDGCQFWFDGDVGWVGLLLLLHGFVLTAENWNWENDDETRRRTVDDDNACCAVLCVYSTKSSLKSLRISSSSSGVNSPRMLKVFRIWSAVLPFIIEAIFAQSKPSKDLTSM